MLQPLPAGWKSNASTNGRLYYYNSATGQRTWHINEVWALVKSGDYTQTVSALLLYTARVHIYIVIGT